MSALSGKRTYDRYSALVTSSAIHQAVKGLLVEHGFERNENTWVRARGLFFDLIDVQRGRSFEGLTVNVALMHRPTYELVWGQPPAFPLSEPECVVRSRLQSLSDGRDRWWQAGDPSAPAEITQAISSDALPFFGSFEELSDVERWLEASKANRYPPEALYLAAVKHLCGNEAQAGDHVEQLLNRTTSGPWRKRIQSLAAALA